MGHAKGPFEEWCFIILGLLTQIQVVMHLECLISDFQMFQKQFCLWSLRAMMISSSTWSHWKHWPYHLGSPPQPAAPGPFAGRRELTPGSSSGRENWCLSPGDRGKDVLLSPFLDVLVYEEPILTPCCLGCFAFRCCPMTCARTQAYEQQCIEILWHLRDHRLWSLKDPPLNCCWSYQAQDTLFSKATTRQLLGSFKRSCRICNQGLRTEGQTQTKNIKQHPRVSFVSFV